MSEPELNVLKHVINIQLAFHTGLTYLSTVLAGYLQMCLSTIYIVQILRIPLAAFAILSRKNPSPNDVIASYGQGFKQAKTDHAL